MYSRANQQALSNINSNTDSSQFDTRNKYVHELQIASNTTDDNKIEKLEAPTSYSYNRIVG